MFGCVRGDVHTCDRGETPVLARLGAMRVDVSVSGSHSEEYCGMTRFQGVCSVRVPAFAGYHKQENKCEEHNVK